MKSLVAIKRWNLLPQFFTSVSSNYRELSNVNQATGTLSEDSLSTVLEPIKKMQRYNLLIF